MDWTFSFNSFFLWHLELIFLPSLVLYSLYFYSTWLYVIRKVEIQQNMFSPATISAPVPSQEALAYVSPVYVRVLVYIWFILCIGTQTGVEFAELVYIIVKGQLEIRVTY
jgi:hypothetical protein